MHLLSLGSVLLTLAFLANASPSFLPDLHHLLTLGSESATSTSPSPPVGGPGKCERKCGPQPRCRPSLANTGSYEKCYQWSDCMKTCEFGHTTPKWLKKEGEDCGSCEACSPVFSGHCEP